MTAMKWHSWLIIAGLTLGFLALDVVSAWGWSAFYGDVWEFLIAALLGLTVGQVNLNAIWAALAPGRVLLRLPWSIFLATLMWYALVLGNRTRYWWDEFFSIYSSNMDMGDAIVLGLVILAGVIVLQAPLWGMSRGFGWRLTPPASAQEASDERQFHLKHLIAGTLLAAVLLGLGRVVLPTDDWGRPQLERELTVLLPAMLIVNLIVVVPCIWIAFVRWRFLALWSCAWLAWATLVSLLEIAILSAILGPPPDDVWITFTLFNLAQGVCVIAALLVLRGAGFRLSRRGRGEKIAWASVTQESPSDIMQPVIQATISTTEPPAEQRL
jgi:hypothetical protein